MFRGRKGNNYERSSMAKKLKRSEISAIVLKVIRDMEHDQKIIEATTFAIIGCDGTARQGYWVPIKKEIIARGNRLNGNDGLLGSDNVAKVKDAVDIVSENTKAI